MEQKRRHCIFNYIYICMEMICKKQRTFLKAGLFNFNIHNSLGIFRQSLCLCSGPLYLGGPTKSQQHVASTYSTNEHEQVNSAVTPSTVPHVMSCHVVSCYGMLSYVILCYVMLYIAMLYLTRTWHLTTAIGSRSIYNKQKGQEYSRAP